MPSPVDPPAPTTSTPDAGQGEPRPPIEAKTSRPPESSGWTVGPDPVILPGATPPQDGPDPDPASRSAPQHQRGVAPSVGVGVVVIIAALITGGLAVTHVGPFHRPSRGAPASSSAAEPPTDIHGTWIVLESFAGTLYPESLHITAENLSTGTFSGTVTSPVGVETITGVVVGTTLSFSITLGSGADRGTATVSRGATTQRIQGVFSNPQGGQGTIFATQSSD